MNDMDEPFGTTDEWLRRMDQAYSFMSDRDRRELHLWEEVNVNSRTVFRSDWPGWTRLKKY